MSNLLQLEEWPLEKAMQDVDRAVRLFFNNQFDQSEEVFRLNEETSMFHAYGLAAKKTCDAIFTMEKVGPSSFNSSN